MQGATESCLLRAQRDSGKWAALWLTNHKYYDRLSADVMNPENLADREMIHKRRFEKTNPIASAVSRMSYAGNLAKVRTNLRKVGFAR